MKIFFFVISLFAVQLSTFAQVSSDPEAKVILDKVSAATDAMEAIHIVFEYRLTNKAENINDSSMGELSLKKDQYLLSFMGLEQISDGENVWTILTDEEEIQISEMDFEDENAVTPSNLLKMYETGFIYQLLAKVGNLQTIELIPEIPGDVDYIKIELLIDTAVNQIKTLKQFGKNATESEYIINNFSPCIVSDDTFKLDEKAYSDFEIIDLR